MPCNLTPVLPVSVEREALSISPVIRNEVNTHLVPDTGLNKPQWRNNHMQCGDGIDEAVAAHVTALEPGSGAGEGFPGD